MPGSSCRGRGLNTSLTTSSTCQVAPSSVERRPKRRKQVSPAVPAQAPPPRSSYQLTNTCPFGLADRLGIHCASVVASVFNWKGADQVAPLSVERTYLM